MGVGGVSYPISDEVQQSLSRFPRIAARLQLPARGSSQLELVRLLDNTHYHHLETLLDFVEFWLERAGPIGDRVVKAKDTFQLNQALVELFLFAQLASEFGVQVHAAQGRPDQSVPDIEVTFDGRGICIEVFSALDFMGFQLLNTHVTRILKYLDISLGYVIEAALRPAREHDSSYPYLVEDENTVRDWLREFAADTKAWLEQQRPPKRKVINGPRGKWRIDLWLREWHDDRRVRMVVSSTGTYSTDTRLFFECGTVNDTARSQWGKKLTSKLAKRQCGDPAPDKLRMLVVDFSQASTGWPDFICWPDIAERMRATVLMVAEEIGAPLPYDVVVPAQLWIECCFGPVIVLDRDREAQVRAFVRAAELDRPCVAAVGTMAENETDAVL